MMLVLLLCVIMKIAEFSVGRISPPLPAPVRPPSPCCNKRKQHKRHYNRRPNDKCTFIFQKRAGGGAVVMEDPHTPGSDCNSNPATDPISQDLIGSEFVQDNLEYQWFIDYGYRDGALHTHPSVLSSLSASYNRDDLGYYDDLARNLDANLAEVDMESFRTADIHTLLTTLPVMYTDPVQHSESNYQRERYASISGSVMEKLDFDSSISPHTSSQGEDSACSTTDTMSICKSSLLFSPVKETPVLPPGGSYSVDSLDCEDMLLTCQANNKNNYTIAFEGSITMYSDGSQDFENQSNQGKQKTYEAPESYYSRKLNLKNTLNLSMARSDSKIYTTWSNLKRCSVNSAMTRHPSGNNNTFPNLLQATGNVTFNLGKKSQSLPDLTETRELRQATFPLNFSVDSAESNNHAGNNQSFGSVMSRSMNEDSSESIGNTSTGKKLQNLSLVKLFMKQKSMSAEGMSLTLDQSGSMSDGGWPTSNSDSTSKTNTHTQILRYNINHTTNDHHPENDFSINWVKGDYYNNGGPETLTETFDRIPRKRSPPIQEYEEESESSISVEELSESMSKSECLLEDTSNKDHTVLKSVHSDPEQRPKSAWSHSSEKRHPVCKTTGIQAIAEVEDNAVQTSLIYPVTNYPPLRDTLVEKKPIYVVYPNYTLPDLSFLNSKDGKFENVALKPQCFKRGRTDWKRPGRTGRPFSCNDIDALKQRGFSHVKDWESLTFLLPTEYKKILQDVPEVSKHMKLNEEIKKPLFCLSPPMRHRTRTIGEMGTNANASLTSSTATQPSSGYRGSSTILTDSSTNQQGMPNNTTNPLYLYRYDSVSSEASLVCQDTKLHRPGCQPRMNCPTLPKRSISLPHGEKESNDCSNGKVPPRPPLPRGILRKKKTTANKRYSMFEIGGVEEIEDQQTPEVNKRMSLQEPYYLNNDIQVLRHRRIIDSEKDVDEIEERYYAERLKEMNRTDLGTEDTESNEDIKQLEEYLKRSGFSSQSSDGSDDNSDLKLRSYVKKFLALKINKDITKTIDMIDSQKKTVSFAVHQRKKFLDNNKTSTLDVTSNLNDDRPIVAESGETNFELRLINLEEKKGMIRSVSKAVDLLLKYWHEEPVQNRLDYIDDKNECSQLCLSNLCPALYAIMSDGLKPQLNSTFGPITNSVWQVVEASSQQGPLTKTLNELVQKINGEDFMTEGMLKFHAFVFGLLNLRALDAWFAYLCTRESILRKHYNSNSLFVDALACVNAREVVDLFLDTLQPLALCPFQLDLLYQCRQLHNSFENMANHAINATTLRTTELPKERVLDKPEIRNDIPSPKKVRPRSCIAYSNCNDMQGVMHKTNLDSATKKRWSNVPTNSKLFHAFDKLASEDSEDYTDSLEHSPLNRAGTKQQAPTKTLNIGSKVDEVDSISGEIKFRRLQEKWELMTGKDEVKEQIGTPSPQSPARTPTSLGKSKIPRLLTSPIRQPTNPISGPMKNVKSPVSGIPALKKPLAIPKVALRKSAELKGKDVPGRTSRVDQDAVGGVRSHLTRPSSLPYKSLRGVTAKEKNLVSPHRRAASTSLPRPTIATASRNPPIKPALKEVRTLTHRLPSDNGHLSFGEGERLKVILEVDAKWLLCARGESKGLVPRAYVHALQT